ncbi:hypothetical protein Q4E93_22030 [Flavitalea sp. BT771]|uniref:hypothetical protein n=1 Tax=Flavitalea sp. BT771 TaxID=3063329 RepID=UPI0026E1CFF9|nr:hypothetical protein [Flavitalea sp. BT771]MDO6433306.1 hypothetical protein [Flavitalea sp. BT771]MDV6222789.1 hypothetical protein [Flavitalea sp. BT771]
MVAKTLLLSGEVKSLSDLLAIIDKTPFSREAKTTPERFNRMLDNPALFRLGDIYNMAQIIGVDDRLLLNLIHNEYIKQRKKKG